ncbi:LOW QUALITY PROTEIN: ankyrin repeat domain-containing protein 7 [Callithrix jacchus]|uniref:LOW QUALITY PROTEIN: ankyrin repeat domain-containing protein 7 n=1 Tax=Callithrix jacchus TaxID=9483 RepID=UPI00159E889E|nr:LOW QUALITY PROTEIN: ankyrin repeat domain-containing protein 7 [Callithrix jacchus]
MNKLFSRWKRRNETQSLTSSDLPIGRGYRLLDKDVKKLHRAASLGDLKKLKKYIQVKKYDVNSQDEQYRTPLHLACANGHTNVVLFLIEQKCKINVQDSENKSPLIVAVQCQKEDCANILLNCGADPNLMDFCYNTALHYAVYGQSFSLVEKLLEHKADLEAKNEDGYTPLLLAVIKSNPKMLKFLLDKGADVNAAYNYQRTALIIAVSGELRCLQRSLLQQGVELSCEDVMDSQLRNMLLSMVLLYTHNQWQIMERRKMLIDTLFLVRHVTKGRYETLGALHCSAFRRNSQPARGFQPEWRVCKKKRRQTVNREECHGQNGKTELFSTYSFTETSI